MRSLLGMLGRMLVLGGAALGVAAVLRKRGHAGFLTVRAMGQGGQGEEVEAAEWKVVV